MPQWTGPATIEGVLADLRQAVAGRGAGLRLWTDEDGWHDEPHE
jgi:hypothetical protein